MRFAASPGFLGAYGMVDSFDANQLGQQAAAGRSLQNRAAMEADAAVRGQEISADATIQAAKYGADATRAQGAAQGQTSMMQGAMGALGSIAGGIGNMRSAAPSAPGFSKYGDYSSLYSQPAIPFTL